MLTAGESQLAISCVTQTSLCSGEQVALLRPKHTGSGPYCGLFSPVSIANNSGHSSWRDTRWYSGGGGESALGPAQTGTDNPIALLPTPPTPARAASPLPPTCRGGRWCGVAAETSAGPDNGLSVRTAGADRGPRAAYCAPRRARHTHADEVRGRRMDVGRGQEWGEGGRARVRHPADDGTFFAPPHANCAESETFVWFHWQLPNRPPTPTLTLSRHTHNLRPSPSTPKHTHKHNRVLEEKVKKSQRKIHFCCYFIKHFLLLAYNHFKSLYDTIYVVSTTISTGSHLFFSNTCFLSAEQNHILITQI